MNISSLQAWKGATGVLLLLALGMWRERRGGEERGGRKEDMPGAADSWEVSRRYGEPNGVSEGREGRGGEGLAK
jgi:hypothetical protein